MTTRKQEGALIQKIEASWTRVTLRQESHSLPEEQRGRAVWDDQHQKGIFAFYTRDKNNLLYPVEFINEQWYQLTFSTDKQCFFTKQDQVLIDEDQAHPFYQETKGKQPETSTATITEQFATAPVFQDIAEDNQPPQPRGDYMPTTMPATFPLKPSRFGNPGFFPRTPWPAQPVQQTAAEALTGLNPEVLEYLVRAMNQYGQNPTSGPQFLQPQENPPKAARTTTEGSLKGQAPKPFTS